MGNPTIHIGSRLGLQDFPQEFLDRLKIKCAGDNPKYFAYERMCDCKPWMRRPKNYKPPPIKLSTWTESGGKIYVLRGLLPAVLKYFPNATIVDYTTAPKVSVPFKIQPPYAPFPDQLVALNDLLRDRFNGKWTGIFGNLSAPTGAGKTYMGFEIAARLQTTTLFLVNTDVLAQQTAEECRKILGFEPGMIKGDKMVIKDFTIGSVQTLVRRIKDPAFAIHKNSFGLGIQDEAHTAAADTFQQVLSFFRFRYCFGMSGTLKRTDGLSWIMFQGTGPTLHEIDAKKLVQQGRILKPSVTWVDTPYIPSTNWDGFEWVEQLTEIVESKIRNDFILRDMICFLPGKNALILTARTKHVDWIYEELIKAFPHLDPIRYHGKLSPKVKAAEFARMKSNASPITISTFQAIGTGLDVKAWEDLLIVTPVKSEVMLKQAIGRIRRAMTGKTRCHIRDYRDRHDHLGRTVDKNGKPVRTTLTSKAAKRQAVYDSF